jgi:putative DNA methylase
LPASREYAPWRSRGYVPHFDSTDVTQAITFRLADALPRQVVETWQDELAHLPEREADIEQRRRIERYLDAGYGVALLRDERVARPVERALLHFDGERYRLHAWVIMPTHVHVVCTPLDGNSLASLAHSWKSYTAKIANSVLGRTGALWQREYFDRAIRDERHFRAIIAYIESNPVVAGLCQDPAAWPFGSARLRR